MPRNERDCRSRAGSYAAAVRLETVILRARATVVSRAQNSTAPRCRIGSRHLAGQQRFRHGVRLFLASHRSRRFVRALRPRPPRREVATIHGGPTGRTFPVSGIGPLTDHIRKVARSRWVAIRAPASSGMVSVPTVRSAKAANTEGEAAAEATVAAVHLGLRMSREARCAWRR